MDYSNRITPEPITVLQSNEVFVFGSNLLGIHGAGAALTAWKSFNAEWGKGTGATGQCYALPTKNTLTMILPLDTIYQFVRFFLNYAELNKDKTFLVTKIGCGYAGYTPDNIAPLFRKVIQSPDSFQNVHLPIEFWEILIEKRNRREI